MDPKTEAAVEIAVSRGPARLYAAPPLHRLMWAVGVRARPPHYAGFASNALLFGGFWGGWMELLTLGYARWRRPDLPTEALLRISVVVAALSVAFGCLLALAFRSRAIKAGLPDWDDLIG